MACLFIKYCKDTDNFIYTNIFLSLGQLFPSRFLSCRHIVLRSFTLSSPIFLPYFSHAAWEKYGRTDPEQSDNERRCMFVAGSSLRRRDKESGGYQLLEKMRGVTLRESQTQRRLPSVEARLRRSMVLVPII